MGDDRLVGDVSGMFVAWVLPTDGIAHAVAQMHTCVSETDARESGGEEHLTLGFEVVRIFDCSGEILDGTAESLKREDIRDGIGTLVGWTVYRV